MYSLIRKTHQIHLDVFQTDYHRTDHQQPFKNIEGPRAITSFEIGKASAHRRFSLSRQSYLLCSRASLLFRFFLTAVLALSLAATADAAIINEPMTSATAPNWVIGGSAYLTASSGYDPVGSGWLRLTEDAGNQAGFAFLNTAFDISQGAVIQFDYVTWGGAGNGGFGCGTTGADGYSIYLFDGSYGPVTFDVGASGGSLGYDKKTVAPVHAGLTGGYIGVGIDEWGNFSNPTEGRLGGPGGRCNAVAVRGPFDHPSGAYYYLGGTASDVSQLAFPGQLFRPSQTGPQYRKVVMYMTPAAAPDYLRIDVYLQNGYTLPLTQVLNGLMVGRPVPASVKVGYAASTGGSTNYHEIRNLVIDPLPVQNIDLGVTNVASSPTVAAGGALIYTVTVRNYGPSSVPANNVPIADSVPAELTGVTWTCAGTGGAVCGAVSGSGNSINTTASLPLNSYATYTISGTVNPATPAGTPITNTATLTVPGGINDYVTANNSASVTVSASAAPISISGMVYSDSGAGGGTAHNGLRDGTEGSTGQTMYAKLFRTADLLTALQVKTIGAAGTFTFNNVTSYDDYTIIISNINDTNYNPAPPNNNWVFTGPANYTLNVSAGGSDLVNQNFGLWNGSSISGKVLNDNGLNGAPASANDGMLNAAETGIAGVTVRLTNSTGGTQYDSTTTDSGGNFALYTNTGSATLRIYETNPAGSLSVSYNPGNTGGSYTIGGEYIQFAYTQYTTYTGIVFGDVQDNSFSPAMNSATATAPATIYFSHTFTPGSGGSISFAVNSQTQSWTKTYYRDTNCSGSYDGGDTVISGALTASAGVPICVLVAETVPAGAPGVTDDAVTRATFNFTNSVGPVVSIYDVTDSTTVVGAAGAGNKPLYLYSAPTYTLSRTKPAGGAAVRLTRGATQVWTETPALQLPVTISNTLSASVPVELNMAASSTGRAFSVALYCSSAPATSLTAAGSTTSTAITQYSLNLPFTGTIPSITCSPPNAWVLIISHTGTVSATRWIDVYPVSGGNYSSVTLPSLNVINVDSVTAYNATYPAVTTPASGFYSGGNTVYVRAAVSDPFGSYDIDANTPTTLPKLTIKDSNNTTVVNAQPMSALASATTSSMKSFEYAYAVPASGPSGTWTLTVTAPEGTEGLVSHTGAGTFRVMPLPSLMIVKSSAVISDPINGVSASAKAIPGAEIQYTLQVINNGAGVADADSIVLSDTVPANMTMYVDAAGTAVTFSCSGCGLTTPWIYANAVSYSYQPGGGPPYVFPPTTIGYDPLVKGVRIKPSGTLNGGGASFTVMYKMQIN
jgi:uncharacterized repeat protein (TIGR01451 family)